MRNPGAKPLHFPDDAIARLLREAWAEIARGEDAWLAVLERLLADAPAARVVH